MEKRLPKLQIVDLLHRAKVNPGLPLLDREKEITQLARLTQKQRHNNAVLIGKRGVGKTSVAYGFARELRGEQFYGLGSMPVIALQVKSAVKLLRTSMQREGALEYIASACNSLPECICVIDDAELLLELLDEPWQFDLLFEPFIKKQHLHLWLICEQEGWANTKKQFHRNLKTFEQITIAQLSDASCVQIVNKNAQRLGEIFGFEVEGAVADALVRASKELPSPRAQPDRALRLLDEVASATRVANAPVMTKKDIEEVVTTRLGLPAARGKNIVQVAQLEDRLNEKVIGQQASAHMIARTMKRALLGLKQGSRPLGSFLFLGPSGVGKTEFAKTLAEQLFGTKDSMVRVDMSEFSDAHTVARLLGAPPGYVGYEAGGQLTAPVQERPYSLVLLDEIEKAHPTIFDIFLQVLDDGRLTDGQGETVDFSKTVFIATSNIGIREIVEGWQKNEDITASSFIRRRMFPLLQQTFRLEFLNRFEGISVFSPLSEKDLLRIAHLEIKKIEARVAEYNISLNIPDKAIIKAIKTESDPRLGARPIKRFIEQSCEGMIAEFMLEKHAKEYAAQ